MKTNQLRNLIQPTIKHLALFAIVFVITFPIITLTLEYGIDGVLVWIFNSAGHELPFNKGPFIFPHGPLAFLLYPFKTGFNLWWFIASLILFKASFYRFCYLIFNQEDSNYKKTIVIVIGITTLYLIPFVKLSLIGISAGVLGGMYLKDRILTYLTPVLVSVTLFMKSDLAVYAILLFILFVTHLIFEKQFKKATRLFLSTLLIAFSLWILLFGFDKLELLPIYILGNVNLLFGNDAAMTLIYDDVIFYAAGWALVILGAFLSLKKLGITTSIILILVLFLGWKHGINRIDSFHAKSFFTQLIWFWAIIYLLTNKWQILVSGIISSLLFHTVLSNTVSDFKSRELSPNSLYYFYLYVESASREIPFTPNYSPYVLNDSLRDVIGNESIVILPWQLLYIPANDFNSKINIIPQQYVANTDWLDSINAQNFKDNLPEFVLLHSNSDGEFLSIDNRSAFNDNVSLLSKVYSNYNIIAIEDRFLLWQKTDKSMTINHDHTTESYSGKLNDWIEITSEAQSITLDADLTKSTYSYIESALLRSKPIFLELELESGERRVNRLPNTIENRGIQISPQVQILNKSILCNNVKRFRIIADEEFYEKEFDYKLNFDALNPFQSKIIASTATLIENKTDEIINLNIVPGDYSGLVSREFDEGFITTISPNTECRFIGYIELNAEEDQNAQFSLRIENQLGEVISSDLYYLSYPFAGNNAPIAIDLALQIPIEEIKNGASLKAFVWNASKEKNVQIKNLILGITYQPLDSTTSPSNIAL